MGRHRQGPQPPGVMVKPYKRTVEPAPEDYVKKFLFLNPRPNGKGTPKAPYTRAQNRAHKQKAPPYPKGLAPHKIKVTVRVELGTELLAAREPGNTLKFKAFNVHTTGITKRGTFHLCMADPRVIAQLRERGYKVPATDLLRIVLDDNPTLWIPHIPPYNWWYPQPRPPEDSEAPPA